MLSDGSGTVLDIITFGPQTDDISTGRCPDGSGPFGVLGSTTFNGPNNCPAYTPESSGNNLQVRVYPNPATNNLVFQCDTENMVYVSIYSPDGRLLENVNMEHGTSSMNTTDLPAGIYFYRLNDPDGLLMASGKLIIIK